MLNDDLDRPQRHVPARYLVRCTGPPLVGGYRLKEMLHSWEELDWVEEVVCQILRNVASQLPNALEHQLRHFCLLGIGQSAFRGERLDDLQEECEKGAKSQSC